MATRTTRSTRKRRSEGKIAKTQTLPRQWKLLQRLPTRGPGKDTDVLTQLLAHDGFEVTKRTVERDLLALKRVFPLKCIRTADRT